MTVDLSFTRQTSQPIEIQFTDIDSESRSYIDKGFFIKCNYPLFKISFHLNKKERNLKIITVKECDRTACRKKTNTFFETRKGTNLSSVLSIVPQPMSIVPQPMSIVPQPMSLVLRTSYLALRWIYTREASREDSVN
jgi:hypothetical protein